MDSNAVAIIRNNHSTDCGTPPQLDSDKCGYLSIYQNEHGEQMVFYKEKETGHTYMRMGDSNWSREFRVVAGNTVNIILNEKEKRFIYTCWQAATWDGNSHKDGSLHDEVLTVYKTKNIETLVKLLHDLGQRINRTVKKPELN